MKAGDLCEYMSRTVLVLDVHKGKHNRLDCCGQELGVEDPERSFRTVYDAKLYLKVISSPEGRE